MNLANIDINTFPSINQKQILLDWVNTINEPQCLLVSESKDLLNGDVFVEILIHFLYITDNKEMLINLQNENINSEVPEIKLGIVLDYFYQICKDDIEYQKIFTKLTKMIKTVIESEELIIELLALLKQIFEKYNINNDETELDNCSTHGKNQDVICNRNKRKKRELNTIQELMEPPNTNSLSIKTSIMVNNDKDKELNKVQQTQNTLGSSNDFPKDNNKVIIHKELKLDKYKTQNNNISSYDDNYSTYFSNKPLLTNSDKVNKSVNHSYFNNKYKHSWVSKSQQKKKTSHSVRNTKQNETNLSNVTRFQYSILSDNNNNMPISLSYSDLNCNKKIDNNNTQMYSKSHKTIINMTRGITQTNKNMFCLNYPFPRMKFIKFLKLTDPVINCNYKTLHKYKIISSINTYNSPQLEIQTQKPPKQNTKGINYFLNDYQSSKNQHKMNKHIIKTIPINNAKRKILSMSPLNTHKYNIYNLNEFTNNNNYKQSTLDNNNNDHKNKIYKWLIYLNLIKSDLVSIEQLHSLCVNGVLLSDIINRCEGRFPILKGISRNPSNYTQIRTNINKVLSHLDSNEKFKSKYLWSVNEIMQGNYEVIWGLLYDIYIYYTKEKSYFVNQLSKAKQRYEQSNIEKIKQEFPLENNNINQRNVSSPNNKNTNTNQVNHITNENEENDLLMVYMNKEHKNNKSKKVNINHLMNVECSEIPYKQNNNSNFLSERERISIHNFKHEKTQKGNNSFSINPPLLNNSINNISYFENDLPNKKRFLLFDKPATSKNKNNNY